ncbi:MAG: MAPEG family protein [Burkholderiales bacterium]|nr:MAPEG family protein [Burkholderiales bacterium]
MTLELQCLAWLLVLAIVQIFAAARAKTHQYGVKWNMSARDGELPPLNPLAARLVRAQANLFETLPLFAAAILIVSIAGRTGTLTAVGAVLYLAARVVYVPLYAAGIPVVRTVVWLASVAGLVMVLLAALLPG